MWGATAEKNPMMAPMTQMKQQQQPAAGWCWRRGASAAAGWRRRRRVIMRHDGGFFSILCLSALENMLVGGPVNSHCGQQQPPGIVDCGSWPWKPLGGWGRCEECEEGDEQPRRAERAGATSACFACTQPSHRATGLGVVMGRDGAAQTIFSEKELEEGANGGNAAARQQH